MLMPAFVSGFRGRPRVLAAGEKVHRSAIERLKKEVPIWKKEYFEDGAVWADGEPFPEEIRVSK